MIIVPFTDELVLLSYASGDNYTGAGHCQNALWKTSLLITCSSGPNEVSYVFDAMVLVIECVNLPVLDN